MKDDVKNLQQNWNLAVRYTNGNLEKARGIIEGTYKNIYALKGFFNCKPNFDQETKAIYGLIILFVCIDLKELLGLSVMVNEGVSFASNRVFSPWLVFEQEVFSVSPEKRERYEERMRHVIMHSLDPNKLFKLIQWLQTDQYETQKKWFISRLQSLFPKTMCDVRIDTELINVIDFHTKSQTPLLMDLIKSYQLSNEDANAKLQKRKKDEINSSELVSLVVTSVPVLSKVGTPVTSLKNGDKIKIIFTQKTRSTLLLARSMNAYSDGNFQSVEATVVQVLYKGPYVDIELAVLDGIMTKFTVRSKEKVAVPSKKIMCKDIFYVYLLGLIFLLWLFLFTYLFFIW